MRQSVIVTLILITCLIACKKEETTHFYTGEWIGTTDENLPIYMCVLSNDIIDSCTLEIRFTHGNFSCDLGFRATVDVAVQDGSFVIPLFGVTPTTLHGSFSSDSTASGTYDSFESEIFILNCDNSLYQGSVGHPAGTWQAMKQ